MYGKEYFVDKPFYRQEFFLGKEKSSSIFSPQPWDFFLCITTIRMRVHIIWPACQNNNTHHHHQDIYQNLNRLFEIYLLFIIIWQRRDILGCSMQMQYSLISLIMTNIIMAIIAIDIVSLYLHCCSRVWRPPTVTCTRLSYRSAKHPRIIIPPSWSSPL